MVPTLFWLFGFRHQLYLSEETTIVSFHCTTDMDTGKKKVQQILTHRNAGTGFYRTHKGRIDRLSQVTASWLYFHFTVRPKTDSMCSKQKKVWASLALIRKLGSGLPTNE